MRKRTQKQNKQDKIALSVRKLLVIALIFILIMGMIKAMATNEKIRNVKIVLSSGYTMNVITNSNKVSNILSENNIIILEGEKVEPDINSEISDNYTIKISKIDEKEKNKKKYFTEEEILESYKSIVEKTIIVEEEIPFETITKDISNSKEKKQDRVVQTGKNGLKEVVYKVKYKNGEEVEKIKVSEKILKEPINKIVEVKSILVTRSGSRPLPQNSSQLEIIWAVVRQEGGGSYESALAVASSAVNRTRHPRWGVKGKSVYEQITARGQYSYSIDNHWRKYLGGNVPEHVKRAVSDAMNGKTNHPYTSFRSYRAATRTQKTAGVTIGGNVYFGR